MGKVVVGIGLIGLLCLSLASAQEPEAGDPPGAGSTISLQLKGVDVIEVLKTIAEQGHLDLVVSGGVTGTVTLFLNDVTVLQALDSVAEAGNLAYTIDGNLVEVMPRAQYQEQYGLPYGAQTVTVPLHYTDAAVVSQALAELRSPKGKILVDARSNALILIDIPEAMERMQEYIAGADVPVHTEVFTLRHADAQSIAALLGPSSLAPQRIRVNAPANQLVITESPGKLEALRPLIEHYDQPGQTVSEILSLSHASYDTLETLLSTVLTPGLGTVTPDPRTGQIIVHDLPDKIPAIKALVERFDERPRQVLIEAKIFQLTLSNEVRLGINWEAVSEKLNHLDVKATFPALANGSGVRVMSGILNDDNYRAMLEALEDYGDINLLSTPRIMATNGAEAKILVGTNFPYVTVDTREDANGVLTRFERVTYLDVGVKLYVRPEVHRDGFVTLKVRPEVSSITGTVTAQSGDIPIVETSNAETSVMVRDGVTVVIGGLIKKEDRVKEKRVPILGRIPLLGYAFKSSQKGKVNSELVVLLTPRIVTGGEPAEELDRLERTFKR